MDEYFLQFLWKYQKFQKRPLILTNGEALTVIKGGFHNQNAGPDFLEAKLIMGSLEWAGAVEVHHKSSDWVRHHHQEDAAYNNVILHVVWLHDQEITHPSGQVIPTLEMQPYVLPTLEASYRTYINQPKPIKCASSLSGIDRIQITSMKDRALSGRLATKAREITQKLNELNGDWNEVAYHRLARNFGLSINKLPFERLATLLPFKVISKHLDHPLQVDALLFGMAGLLEDPKDHFQTQLHQEFHFLQTKYRLPHPLSRTEWKFAKTRPANFPTVRLAQLSKLLQSGKDLLTFFTEYSDIKTLKKNLHVVPEGYWKNHYDFGKPLKSGNNNLGTMAIENILINTASYLMAAYAKATANDELLDKAGALLENLQPENNRIIKEWSQAGVRATTAYDTQGLIHQYNACCLNKKCLECNIGISILNH